LGLFGEDLIKLKFEKERVNHLIKKYDAFKSKNILEENLNNSDVMLKVNDHMKSGMKIHLSKIEGLPKGEYKFSLFTAVIPTKNNVQMTENSEEIHELKLNHIVKIDDEDPVALEDKGIEYFFPENDIYSYELSFKLKGNAVTNYDSGTNVLYFYIKIENLNKNTEDVILTEYKTLLDVFLSNLTILMDNISLMKTFFIEVKVGTFANIN